MKRISLFIFAFIITISFLFVNVNADTKKYTTESVDFDVFLTEIDQLVSKYDVFGDTLYVPSVNAQS